MLLNPSSSFVKSAFGVALMTVSNRVPFERAAITRTIGFGGVDKSACASSCAPSPEPVEECRSCWRKAGALDPRKPVLSKKSERVGDRGSKFLCLDSRDTGCMEQQRRHMGSISAVRRAVR